MAAAKKKDSLSNLKRQLPIDATDYLDSDAVIAYYLHVTLASEHPELVPQATADVAKASGTARLTEDVVLGRGSLYSALVPGRIVTAHSDWRNAHCGRNLMRALP